MKAIKSRENCLNLLKCTLSSSYFDIKNKGILNSNRIDW